MLICDDDGVVIGMVFVGILEFELNEEFMFNFVWFILVMFVVVVLGVFGLVWVILII